MAPTDICGTIERLNADEHSKAAAIGQRLLLECSPLGTHRVRDFFADLVDVADGRRSNLALGVCLPHQLLIGLPTVIDLSPMSEQQFERYYRISLRFAEQLAESGWLIPNLYNSVASAWKDYPHFHGLVKMAKVNHTRVGHFFKACDSQFEAHIDRHREVLEKKIRNMQTINPRGVDGFLRDYLNRPDRETSDIDREQAANTVARRWAYLDVLAPQAAMQVAAFVEDSNLLDAQAYIRSTKHMYVSPVTAALGGDFLWGRPDIAIAKSVGLIKPPRARKYIEPAEQPEAFEYLFHHMTRVQAFRIPEPFECVDDFGARELLRLLNSKTFATAKLQMYEALEIMTRLAQQGEVDEGTVAAWREAISEIQQGMRKLKARMASASTNLRHAATVVGTFLQMDYGILPCLSIGVVGTHFVGKAIRPINPDKHRLLVLLDELRSSD